MVTQGAGTAERTYDAIVVGSGISGGWAAKELTEKGLRTLVLERGRDVKHPDYPTAMLESWQFAGRTRPLNRRRGEAGEAEPHRLHHASRVGALVRQRRRESASEVQRFDWMRGYHVGGRSLLWGRQSHLPGAISTSRPTPATAWPSTGRSATPTLRRACDYTERFADQRQP